MFLPDLFDARYMLTGERDKGRQESNEKLDSILSDIDKNIATMKEEREKREEHDLLELYQEKQIEFRGKDFYESGGLRQPINGDFVRRAAVNEYNKRHADNEVDKELDGGLER